MRKPLSKATRFEVFKRDEFTCQYCGSHPPAAILHVDHILAVANGGLDQLPNLITACSECNLGKGVRRLEEVPPSLAETADRILETERQIKGWKCAIRKRETRIRSEVNSVESWWPSLPLSSLSRRSIARFVERIGVFSTRDAMKIAADMADRKEWDDERMFRYFCGICWNKINAG